MASNRFVLEYPKKDKETKILLIIRFNNTRLVYYLPVKIHPKYWKADIQRVGNFAAVKNKIGINELLNKLDTAVSKFIDARIVDNKQLTKDSLKNFLDEYFNPVSEQEKSFLGFIDKLIEYECTRINPSTGRTITEGTVKSLKGTREQLRLFEIAKYKLTFENITLDWYYDFVAWCNTKNYAPNNIGKHIKNLKKFMGEAVEQELTANMAFRSKRFIVIKEDVDNIYLTIPELKRMYALDLSKKPTHGIARDLFLVGAFTGLRVSDFNDIKPENITKRINGYRLKVKTQKTNAPVIIPLHPIALAIINKHKGAALPYIADQTINEKIKEVGKWAEITELETIIKTVGGLKITKRQPRYELIKTHTARRSFCTNAYLSDDMAIIDIMAISTHKTESSFMKYIKITKDQQADRMAKSSFFQDKAM